MHWKVDLCKGAFSRSSPGTLVERKTRFILLARIKGNGVKAAGAGFRPLLNRLPSPRPDL